MRREREILVVQYGVGAMAEGAIKMLTEKDGVRVVGAIDVASEKVGKDLGTVVGTTEKLGVRISDDAEKVLAETEPDVVIYTTPGFTAEGITPDITSILRSGANVVSSNVGFFYPFYKDPALAKKINRIARENKVSIICTGVNPGFVLDTLIITLTGVCESIEDIKGNRTIDFAPYGSGVLDPEGFGLTSEEWKRRKEEEELLGHTTFDTQIQMIADAVGIDLDRVEERKLEPIIAEEKREVESEFPDIESGQTAGFTHIFDGVKDGEPVITLKLVGAVEPEKDDLKQKDEIHIRGRPNIDIETARALEPGVTTWAILVNSIPEVINAEPGLVTMKDLPIPSATLGDMRRFIAWDARVK